MIHRILLALSLLALCSGIVIPQQNQETSQNVGKILPYQTRWSYRRMDHFSNSIAASNTFKARYLVNEDYWNPKNGSIFFYAGNEGPIDNFWNNTGFVMELAPDFNALIVFPEHRFYGESLPMGNQSFQAPYLNYLTMDQALADYAELLVALKAEYNASNNPVITFGGSYGGVLAAFMRMRYPNLVDGALAASAPLLTTSGLFPNNTFFEAITKVADQMVPGCSDAIRRSFSAIEQLKNFGQLGIISQRFNLCTPMRNEADYKQFLGWARNAWAMMAMVNYPYPADFMGPLPAWPIKNVCSKAVQFNDIIAPLVYSSSLLYNASAVNGCFDIYAEYVNCADPTGCGNGNDATAWDIQACGEIELSGGSFNTTDMFPYLPWTKDERAAYCAKKYNLKFREDWTNIEFWIDKLESAENPASNIIFSNGLLDPWAPGGILKNSTNGVFALLIPDAAHHLDLRASNPADPLGVIMARKYESYLISNYVAEKWSKIN